VNFAGGDVVFPTEGFGRGKAFGEGVGVGFALISPPLP